MTIAEAREKCKILIGKMPRDIFIIIVLIFASSASFGLGYLAGIDAGKGNGVSVESLFPVDSSTGKFVASKNGTKYYLPSCTGVDKISDANKIWFVSVESATAAGYTPATNCKGL
ncbi:MAG: hypothetical protein NTY93_02225 [Candidatus Kaiserbacteria bacterium]|nr:hypothetical protein [Candidatus Kaiserbacteria bacterium]